MQARRISLLILSASAGVLTLSTASTGATSKLPLDAEPSHLNFHRVLNEQGTGPVDVVFTNTSDHDVTVTSKQYTGDAASLPYTGTSNCLVTLVPGQQCTDSIGFINANIVPPGSYNGTLELLANGVVVGELRLHGTAL
jgi:hypothetical protein